MGHFHIVIEKDREVMGKEIINQNEIEEIIPHIDLIIRLKEQKAMIDKATTHY